MPQPRRTTRHRISVALLALVIGLVVVASACSAGRDGAASARISGPSQTPSPAGRPVGLPAVGSSGGDSIKQPAGPATTAASGSAGQPGLGAPVVPAQSQVVRSADVVVDVSRGNVPTSYDAVANLATANGGFVADSSLSTTEGSAPSGRLTLRIPVEHLGPVLTALGRMGRVAQQDQQGSDVTGQLVDLAARIKSLQAEEDATRTLLGRAQAIGDILQIQGQLFNLRTQIEQLAGQQAQLNDKAAYATIAVQVVESGRTPLPVTKSKSTFLRAWRLAGHNIVAVIDGAALALGWVSPLLVVALAALPALLWWRRRVGAAPATSDT